MNEFFFNYYKPKKVINKNSNIPPTYIKEVAIELQGDFSFDNLPHKKKNTQKPFVGRVEEREKFVKMLKSGKGVYLVTGYRGMGKTSFVNVALDELKEETKDKKLTVLNITIAQKQPSETEILKLLVSVIRDKCIEKLHIDRRKRWQKRWGFLLKWIFIFSVTLFLLLLYKSNELERVMMVDGFNFGSTEKLVKVLKWILVVSISVMGILLLFIGLLDLLINRSFFKTIDDLYKRCHASTSFENENLHEITLEGLNTKVSNKGNKRTENYPIASSKEIEHELMIFLKDPSLQKRFKFVFVFDELDKVEQFSILSSEGLPVVYSSQNPEKAYLDQLRERRDAIQNIIAGLKNFLTTSDSAFIFIAGREMFDASMADISDRQSSISSIFSYVFYIESLLREKVEGTSSLSAAIERYLFILLHGKQPEIYEGVPESLYAPFTVNTRLSKRRTGFEKVILGRKDEYENVNQYYEDHAVKVNLLLQSFVVYLTYRSNGSPKKLIRLIHEFVRTDLDTNNLDRLTFWQNPKGKPNGTGAYLHFNYKQQQRIGFINYIYRPFLVKYGNSFKNYSDNLIVSTSFLFDHLLKFHPFAFSHSHLELIPEVLSTNSTPALRDHIKKIIEYLSLNHIKETEIGLFDYKFYSKTVNEIFYLSKTFEEESAAFNFTLDESHLIKLHVRGKLRDLRAIYNNTQGAEEKSSQLIFSIAYLNGVLGDLHFFDQEYDDAIIAYSDVLKPIRNLDLKSMNMRDFILLQKYKLKLGLTFEKIKSFEESLSLYSDAVQDAKRFIVERMSGELLFYDKNASSHLVNDEKDSGTVSYISSSLSDILQIINQAFLAKMVLQEKMGVEGITAGKNAITIGGFLHLSDMIAIQCGMNSTIVSNFYLQVGNLLYLKNSIKAFEWDAKDKVPGFPPAYLRELKNINDKHNKLFLSDKTKYGHYRVPVMALNMYCLGLKSLINNRIKDAKKPIFNDETKILEQVLKSLDPDKLEEHYTSLTKIHFKYIAIYLSHIGDCMLSMLTSNGKEGSGFTVAEIVNPKKLAELVIELYCSERKGKVSKEKKGSNFTKLFFLRDESKENLINVHSIICFYYLSGHYFRKCSRSRSYSFQLRKILYLVRLVVSDCNNSDAVSKEDNKVNQRNNRLFITALEKIVVTKILKAASYGAEFSDVHDQQKFSSILQDSGIEHAEKKIRNNISNFPDTREAVLLLSHIKLRLLQQSKEKLNGNVFSDNSISTQYLRLVELTYAAKLYEKKLRLCDPGNIEEVRNHCVCYLHSLTGVIQIMEVYDNDYLVGSSFLAYHHFRLASFFDFTGNKNSLKIDSVICNEAKEILVRDFLSDKSAHIQFDRHYNYEMAALHYDKSIKLHSGGDDYKKAINDVLYLEDDLNDASYHFGAAMDRYLMINGKLKDYYLKSKLQQDTNWNTFDKFGF